MATSTKKKQTNRKSTKPSPATGTRKSPSTAKKPAGKRISPEQRKQLEQEEMFRNEIIVWSTLAVSIILFVSNLGIGGKIGGFLSNVSFALFGMLSYIVPFVLFFGTAFAISNRKNHFATLKLVAGILFIWFLCLFLELSTANPVNYTSKAAFTMGFRLHKGGGALGGMLAQLFYPNFGVIGAYAIDIMVLIISFVLLTERSIFSSVQKGSQKIYDSAKEDAKRRQGVRKEKRNVQRQYKKERQEQQQALRRVDKKVSGVADTTIRRAVNSSDDLVSVTPESVLLQDAVPTNATGIREPELSIQQMERVSLKAEEIKSKKKRGTKGNLIPFIASSDTPAAPSVPEPSDDMIPLFPKEDAMPDYLVESDLVRDIFEDEIEEMNPIDEPDLEEVEDIVTSEIPMPQHESEIPQRESEMPQHENKMPVAAPPKHYAFPPVKLLNPVDRNAKGDSREHLQKTANKLQQTLKNFGVNVTITNVSCGPSVTRYELQPEMGVKVSKIVNLTDDIKLNLAAEDIRMEAPIPGKAAIGIEVPNKENVTVSFRELIETDDFKKHKSDIAFVAGKDIAGKTVVADIAKMPHLLIAGATGSGKSVCINTIIMSILYKAKPEDVKLIMIDPKVVELSVYNGIPHLFIPVVTDPKKAAGALNWAVAEMTDRYNKFAEYGVRDMNGYNKKIESIKDIEDENKPVKMPRIVIIVDELADLMMVAPGDVEDAICRLAQLARAAGIHLIIATQRPSVNVITGLIKANMPSRIAFAVSSGVDSRTILDMNGAEKLLGKGDMLFYPQGIPKPQRVQGAFVSDKEVADVVDFLKNENQVEYSPEIEAKMNSAIESGGSNASANGGADERDSYFVEAGKFLIDINKASIGQLQRRFKIGFNRAARIMDQLEEAGVVGPEQGTKPREILMSEEAFESYIEEYV